MFNILILNGPNLNLLGNRETDKYGYKSLGGIITEVEDLATDFEIAINHVQSNSEYELIETIHDAQEQGIDFIVFNPAAFTHTSIALRDALLAANIPFIEVHLSNLYKREKFRHYSYFSDIAVGSIIGLGSYGYQLAVLAAKDYFENNY